MISTPLRRQRALATFVVSALIAALSVVGLALPAQAAEPGAPTVTVSKTSDLASKGEVVTVRGTGFLPTPATTGTRPPLAGKFTGAYVGFGRFADVWAPSAGAPSAARTLGDNKWAVRAADMATVGGVAAGAAEIKEDGTFEITLTAEKSAALEALTRGNYGIYTYAGGGAKYAPFETYTPVSFAPGVVPVVPPTVPTVPPSTPAEPAPPAPAPEQCEAGDVLGATLNWGVKKSFVAYVTGSIAKGKVSTKGKNVAKSGGTFRWTNGDGTFVASKNSGSIAYTGTIEFSGHNGVLKVTLTNPTIVVKNAKTANLVVDAQATDLDGNTVTLPKAVVATLNLSKATKSVKAGVRTFSNAPATLTATGAKAFAGFYEKGEALDPLTFVVPVADGTTCPAPPAPSAPDAKPKPKPTKPAPVTIDLGSALDDGKIEAGQSATFVLSGLKPGASVRASVHPNVVDLGIKKAKKNGTVSFAWKVPANFPAGVHTFKAKVGSKTYSKKFTVVASSSDSADNPAPECVANSVSGATLDWGVKAAFVSYITGPIAQGSYSTNGATKNGGKVRWNGGSGAYNTDSATGSVAYNGSVTLKGHDGILNLTLSSPRIIVSGASAATLVLNVNGTDMDGNKLSFPGVQFATLNLGAGSKPASGSAISYSGVPATLTAAGAKAFIGFYEAGTALDALSFTLPLGAKTACGPGTGSLPKTGAGLEPIGLAVAFLILGAAAMGVARKRHRGIYAN